MTVDLSGVDIAWIVVGSIFGLLILPCVGVFGYHICRCIGMIIGGIFMCIAGCFQCLCSSRSNVGEEDHVLGQMSAPSTAAYQQGPPLEAQASTEDLAEPSIDAIPPSPPPPSYEKIEAPPPIYDPGQNRAGQED